MCVGLARVLGNRCATPKSMSTEPRTEKHDTRILDGLTSHARSTPVGVVQRSGDLRQCGEPIGQSLQLAHRAAVDNSIASQPDPR